MRIISGHWKGRQVQAPASLPVRPTTDMAKEGLFNWLEQTIDFQSTVALDLFTGTGNITFELLSRNVPFVVAVDKDFKCIQFIKSMLVEWQALERVALFRTDAVIALERLKTEVNLVFADPPYTYTAHQELLHAILKCKQVSAGANVVIEHPAEVKWKSNTWQQTKRYGKVHFSIFTKP